MIKIVCFLILLALAVSSRGQTNTNVVVADTGAPNNFLTGISNVGVITKAQPSFSNLSGAASNAQLPDGINKGNAARQSQVVVSGTAYYITSSNLNLPATLKDGMSTTTRFIWRVHLDKTAAGTGTFQIIIYRGINGSTSDTADVTQTIGTQTAVADNMVMDVMLTVTATGATGSYFWSICPMQRAATATGFGIVTGTTGLFTGTVSSVAMNTASLIFGLGFKATTGTPTISIPFVDGRAINID